MENIRIPIGSSSPRPRITAPHVPDFIIQEVVAGIEHVSANVRVDHVYMNEHISGRFVEIGMNLGRMIHQDRTETKTSTKYGWTQVPVRLRDAVKARMFGLNGEEIPEFWPEWLRKKFTPQTREIMTQSHTVTNVTFARACPHQGHKGHATFMFGPDLAFAERSNKARLYAVAERAASQDLIRTILELKNEALRGGVEPTMISLGHKEAYQLEDEIFKREMGPPSRGGIEEFAGLEIERVSRDTYLSIS